jgi:hypothetical protein
MRCPAARPLTRLGDTYRLFASATHPDTAFDDLEHLPWAKFDVVAAGRCSVRLSAGLISPAACSLQTGCAPSGYGFSITLLG